MSVIICPECERRITVPKAIKGEGCIEDECLMRRSDKSRERHGSRE